MLPTGNCFASRPSLELATTVASVRFNFAAVRGVWRMAMKRRALLLLALLALASLLLTGDWQPPYSAAMLSW